MTTITFTEWVNMVFTTRNMAFFLIGLCGTLLLITLIKWIQDRQDKKERKRK